MTAKEMHVAECKKTIKSIVTKLLVLAVVAFVSAVILAKVLLSALAIVFTSIVNIPDYYYYS